MAKFITGTKYFRFESEDETPEVVRVRKYDEEDDRVIYQNDKKERFSLSSEAFTKKYRALKADGMMMFTIVELEDDLNDVIVSVNKIPCEDNIPFAICRQSIYDFFTNDSNGKVYDNNNAMYVGVSVSKETCPANIQYEQLLICNEVKYNNPVVVYVDDTLDSILSLFRTKKYDDTLRIHKQTQIPKFSGMAIGYAESLKQLLEINNFMYDFRKCFGVVDLPLAIGDAETLDIGNTEYLEREVKKNIMNTYVMKYSREINFDKMARDYVLATSSAEKYENLYIVAYDATNTDYVPRFPD